MHSNEWTEGKEELGLRLKDSRIVRCLAEGRAFPSRDQLSLGAQAGILHAWWVGTGLSCYLLTISAQ